MEPAPRFNLDQAVAAWRDELARHPGPAPADLRELEAHLRDGFAELKKKNLSDEEAFLVARHRVGQPVAVAGEFAKAKPARFWRRRIFWATFLIVFGAFAARAFFAMPEYRATASLSVFKTEEMPMDSGLKNPADDVVGPEEFNTRMRVMETRDIAVAVAGRMSDQERNAFLLPFRSNNSAGPEMNLVDRLLSRRTVSPGRRAYIMEIGVEHPDPQLAAKVADYFAEEFINYNSRLTVEKAMRAVDELQQQEKQEGNKVEQLQAEMNALVDNNKNSDFSKVQGQYDNLAAEKDTADAMRRQMLTAIEQQRSKIVLSTPSYQIIDHATGSVVQSEPKTALLLTSGFLLGLTTAFIALIIAFLLSHFRPRPPPAKLVS